MKHLTLLISTLTIFTTTNLCSQQFRGAKTPMNTKETIIITGGAGYIGSHTSLLMAQKGYNIIVVDKYLHNQPVELPWATVIKEEYAKPTLLAKLFTENNVVAVMHFAAFIEVGESVKNPLKYYENNTAKTLVLLQSMVEHNVKTFIFSSTAAVYGTPQYLPLTEDHPKNPINPYGKTKLMVEMALEDLCSAYGLKYVALRYFNAAGAEPEYGLGEYHQPESHLIPRILNAAKNGLPFTVFGSDYPTPDGTCVRDYLHVSDIANAHLLAYEHLKKGKPSDCFNLGTNTGTSVKEMIKTVEDICKVKVNAVYKERRAGDPAFLVASADKAKKILGWEPQHSDLKTILTSALQVVEKQLVAQN